MYYYKINNVALASEVILNEANGYADAEPITAEQYQAMINPEPIPINELEVARASKLQSLNLWAYTFVSAGYTDSITGYKLFCSENDVANYATLKNAIMDMANDTVVEIGTMTGWQTSTKGVVYPLLVRYSAYMLPFTTAYMKLKSYIEYATTIEEINLIVWE